MLVRQQEDEAARAASSAAAAIDVLMRQRQQEAAATAAASALSVAATDAAITAAATAAASAATEAASANLETMVTRLLSDRPSADVPAPRGSALPAERSASPSPLPLPESLELSAIPSQTAAAHGLPPAPPAGPDDDDDGDGSARSSSSEERRQRENVDKLAKAMAEAKASLDEAAADRARRSAARRNTPARDGGQTPAPPESVRSRFIDSTLLGTHRTPFVRFACGLVMTSEHLQYQSGGAEFDTQTFAPDFLYGKSRHAPTIRALLKEETHSTLGKKPKSRSFSNAQAYLSRKQSIHDNRSRSARAYDGSKLRLPKRLSSSDHDDAARAWLEYRPSLFQIIRQPLDAGNNQAEVLRAIYSVAQMPDSGHQGISAILEQALNDEPMQGVPLIQWDAILSLLDQHFLSNTVMDGVEDSADWRSTTARLRTQGVPLLIERLQRAYVVYREVKYTDETLQAEVAKICATRANFDELLRKFYECILNDEDDPERGIYLAPHVQTGYDAMRAVMNHYPEGDDAKIMLSDNLNYLHVHHMIAAEKEYHRNKKTKAPHKPAAPVNGIQAPQQQPQQQQQQQQQPHQHGAVYIPPATISKKHPQGTFLSDKNENPHDAGIKRVWVAAVKANDVPTQERVRTVLAEGRARQGQHQRPPTQIAAVPPSGAGGMTFPSLAAPPSAGRGTAYSGAPKRNYGRTVAPPANGLGNPHNVEWTEEQWRDMTINFDNIPLYTENPDFAAPLSVLSRCRPCDASCSMPRVGRPTAATRDATLPNDTCPYCCYGPRAPDGPLADERHPENWRYGTGRGDHPERACQAQKRAFVEGGPAPSPPPELVANFHQAFVLKELPKKQSDGTYLWKYGVPPRRT